MTVCGRAAIPARLLVRSSLNKVDSPARGECYKKMRHDFVWLILSVFRTKLILKISAASHIAGYVCFRESRAFIFPSKISAPTTAFTHSSTLPPRYPILGMNYPNWMCIGLRHQRVQLHPISGPFWMGPLDSGWLFLCR